MEVPVTPEAPVTPDAAATPATAAEQVTLSKAEHDQLLTQAARAAEAQSRADRLTLQLRSQRGSTLPDPKETPQVDRTNGAEEDAKAERELLRLASDPELRTVLDADTTLRDLIRKNPIALVPIYAPDAIDAEDAVSQVRARLLERKPKETPKAPDPVDQSLTVPPVGGVNTPERGVESAIDTARKNPDAMGAALGMLNAKLNLSGK